MTRIDRPARWLRALLATCTLAAPPVLAERLPDPRLAHTSAFLAAPSTDDPAPMPWQQSNVRVGALGGHAGHLRAAPAAAAPAAPATHGQPGVKGRPGADAGPTPERRP